MAFFHHNIIKKYTIAMLDLFNEIEIVRKDDAGNVKGYHKVPVKFGTRDSIYDLLKTTETKLKNGDNLTVPAIAIQLRNFQKSDTRSTNKHSKFTYRSETVGAINYIYDSVPYDFNFEVAIITKTMTDFTMIVEQIIPRFNPFFNMNINELDFQDSPTSVPLELNDISFNINEDFGAEEDRFIEGTLGFILKGNFYMPIQEASIVEKMKIYINEIGDNNIYSRLSNIQITALDNFPNVISEKIDIPEGGLTPVITDIELISSMLQGTTQLLNVLISDNDSEIFTYVWTSNIGSIASGAQKVNYTAPIGVVGSVVATITCTVIDNLGNQSNSFNKTITITEV
jgi:hypothetical protein